jgi:hypothetical protein
MYLKLSEPREIKEFEWYLRDHFFRQSNKGLTQFERESLAKNMITQYLRYKSYTPEKINELMNPVLKKLILSQLIIGKDNINIDNNKSFELTSPLSRLQCSTCFYISYLSANEPKNCLRCSSYKLHDFPKTIQKKK